MSPHARTGQGVSTVAQIRRAAGFEKTTKNRCCSFFLRVWFLQRVLEGRLNALYGISLLRKICNHPDLLKLGRAMSPEEKASFGDYRHSAKLLVLHQVENPLFLCEFFSLNLFSQMLPLWKEEVFIVTFLFFFKNILFKGHRVLLFSQV